MHWMSDTIRNPTIESGGIDSGFTAGISFLIIIEKHLQLHDQSSVKCDAAGDPLQGNITVISF